MNDVNWWLMALAFVLGLALTFALMIRRVTREVPVSGSVGVRGPDVVGAVRGGLEDRGTAPSLTTDKLADTDVRTTKMPAAGAAAAGAAAAGGVAASKFAGGNGESATAKTATVSDEPYGAGSVRVAAGASAPSGYTIKGNEDSMVYHTTDGPSYKQTIADVWFRPGVNTTPPRREIGSWVLASAAFMLIAFRQTYVLPYVPLGLSPARFVLFAAAGLFIITRLAGQRSRYRIGVLGPVLALYSLSTLAAYGAGMMRPSTPIVEVDANLIREFLAISLVFFFFTVIHGYVGLRRVIKGLVAGGVVSAVLAILAHFTGVEAATMLRLPGLRDAGAILNRDLVRVDVVRPQASAGHPLELAVVLAMIFPLALGLTQSLRARGERWWPWAVATAIILAGIAVSVSRGAVLGLVAAFVVMARYWPIRRTLGTLAVIGVGLMVGPVLESSLFEAYSKMFGLGLEEGSINSRQTAAEDLLSNIPLFGMYGQGGSAKNPPTLDNDYLSQLQEIGVLGLLSYLMVLGTTLALAFLAFRNARNRASTELPASCAHLFLALAASFTAYAAMSIFLDVSGFIQTWTTMYLLIAASAVAFRISRKVDGEFARTNTPPRKFESDKNR
jgi:hypothetical protein